MLLFNKPTAISYISKSGDKIYPVVIDIKEGVKSSETLSFMTADSNTGILSVAFMEGETIYNIDDATVVCDIERPDGTDLSIGAVKVADGVVEVPLGVNGTSQPGMYMFDFKIVRPGSKTVGVPLVSYTVTQSINVDEIVTQDDRLPVLNDLIVKIQNATSASTQATNECNKVTDNVANAMKSINNAIASGTVDLELKQLRTSLNGILHPTANDRLNQMETHLLEATATTIETESSFITVDATNNGYFEDVKLEGKTLVNLANISSKFVETTSRYYIDHTLCETSKLDLNKPYTFIIYCNYLSNHNTNYNYFEFGAGNKMGYFSSTISTNAKYNKIDMPTSGIYTMLLEFTDFKGCEYLACRPCRRSLAPVEGEIANYDISILLLEGDHTNNPSSYFEGLLSVGQDVEEVSVASLGATEDINYYKDIYFGTSVVQYTFNPVITKSKYVYNNSDKPVELSLYVNNSWSKDIPIKPYECTFVECPTNSSLNVVRFTKQNGWKLTAQNINNIMLVSDHPIKVDKKPLLYYNPTTETWEKPILREWDTIEKHSDGKYYYHKRSEEVVFNGSENGWSIRTDREMEDTQMFTCNIGGDFVTNGNDINLISDKFNSTLDTFAKNVEGFYRINGYVYLRILKSKLTTQDVTGFKAWLQANPVKVVYQLAQEEVYECTNIDLMTYSGETNYIINSGAISPKSLLKVHNNIANVVKILQEKVSLLENTFIVGLKSVLAGDMYSLATILYPEDFIQNDNTEQDIMVIPE